jgi:O-antigen/teichoic acid export membrane protein
MNNKILKSLTGSLSVKVLGMIGAFGLGVVLTRMLGLEQYGLYSYIISIISLFAIPSYTGWTNSLIKSINDNVLKKKHIICYTFGLNLVIALAALIFVNFSITKLNFTYLEILLLAFLFAIPANFGGVLRSSGFKILGQLPDVLIKPYLFLFLLFILYFLKDDISVSNVLYTQAVCLFLISIILLFIIQNKVSLKVSISNNSKIIKIAIPFMLVGFANSINSNLPVILTGNFSTIDDVGLLRVAQQNTAIINISLSAVLAWLAPDIDINKTEKKVLKNKIYLGMLFSLIPALILAVILITFSEDILLLLFGESFVEASSLITILSINEIILCLFLIFQLFLNMSGYQKYCLYTLLKVITLNIICCFILIPLYGSIGAALASLISNIVWMLFIVRFSLKVLKNEVL